MFERLLVPLDGSRFSSHAIEYAEEIAGQFGSKIILLRVVEPIPCVPSTTGVVPDAASPAVMKMYTQAVRLEDEKNRKRAMRYMARKVREIKADTIGASYQVRTGDPALSILEFSKRAKIDMIVMTTHSKSGLKRFFLGSVADTVTRTSSVPVLVIHPKTRGK